VVLAESRAEVYAEIDGYITQLVVDPGALVEKGQILGYLANPEIEEQVRMQEMEIRRMLDEKEIYERQSYAKVSQINKTLSAAYRKLRFMRQEAEGVNLRAPQAGVWIPMEAEHLVGRLLIKGNMIGEVILPGSYYFRGVVNQDDASGLFNRKIREEGSEVRLIGEAGTLFHVSKVTFIPAEQQLLPSSALGWRGGGEIEVDMSDPNGLKTKESFYLVDALLKDKQDKRLKHNRTGVIRFALPWEPVFWQGLRWFRQVLQEKHKF
jgi:putative peptide zinc metalloprotease protein